LVVIRADFKEQSEEETFKIVTGNKKLIFEKASPSLQVALKYCEVIAFMWLGPGSMFGNVSLAETAAGCPM
jgi:hypothetical protein